MNTQKSATRNTFLIASIFFALLLTVSLASAAIEVTKPTNSSLNTGNVVFNVTFSNATDITNALNVTFYYNLSGTWTAIGTINNGSLSPSSIQGSLSTTGLTNGYYTINATVRNTTDAKSATIYTYLVLFDNSNPTLSLSFPDGNLYLPSDSIKVTTTATDTSTLTYSTALIDTSNAKTIKTITGANPTFKSPDTDVPGYYKITTTVTDSVSKTTSVTKYVEIKQKASLSNAKVAVANEAANQVVAERSSKRGIIIGVVIFVVIIFLVIIALAAKSDK
jgi:hypothetical protein